MNKAQALAELGTAFYNDQYRTMNPQGILDKASASANSAIAAKDKLADLSEKMDKAPRVTALLTNVANKSETVKPFAEAVVKKLKQDPNLIQHLEADLAKDPVAAQKLQESLQGNQAQAAQIILKYDGKNLGTLLGTTPAAAPATISTPVAATVAAPAAATTEKKPAARSTPTGQQHTKAPASAISAATPTTVVTPTVAPDIEIPPLPAGTFSVDAIGQKIFAGLATKSDADISQFFSTKDTIGKDGRIAQLAGGIADAAHDKFGVSESVTKGFEERIAGDTALQGKIAENLKGHPGFVKSLAKMASGESEMPDAMKTAAKKEMENLMEKPELLADDKYVKGIQSKLQMGEGMGKLGGLMQNMFGIDMKGMMGNIGEFFHELMQKIMDFIGNLTGNPKMGLASNLNLAMGDNLRSRYERPSMKALPTDGKLFHDVKHGDRTVQEAHTIKVQGADGKTVDLIPTDGAVNLGRDQGGNVTLRTARSIEPDGSVKYTKDTHLSPQGFDQYKAEVAMRGAAVGVKDGLPAKLEAQTTYFDPKTGSEMPPQGQQPRPPESTVKQDLGGIARTATNQMGMDMIGGG
ncbi:MAG: hypothetical protein H6864_08425 [Micavibrio sp.]|nr:hypothetical protein [Micavibrio sp.]